MDQGIYYRWLRTFAKKNLISLYENSCCLCTYNEKDKSHG